MCFTSRVLKTTLWFTHRHSENSNFLSWNDKVSTKYNKVFHDIANVVLFGKFNHRLVSIAHTLMGWMVSSCVEFPWSGELILLRARKAKSGVEQLVHFVSPSVYKHRFMMEEALHFHWMLYFEHEPEDKFLTLPYLGSEFVLITHAHRGVR